MNKKIQITITGCEMNKKIQITITGCEMNKKIQITITGCVKCLAFVVNLCHISCNVPNTTIAEFANSVDPDTTAHNEPSHLDYTVCPLLFDFST